jgi:hypothetical protein
LEKIAINLLKATEKKVKTLKKRTIDSKLEVILSIILQHSIPEKA